MDREIKRISADSTHQICSAQVITSCESVIKELIENSLDAGATNIEVRFQNYGLDLIEVIDNGSGIASNDFDGITMKHHTSKLRQFDGLLSVRTFGFRGEALSSLCAVSELSIHTYNLSDPTGTLLSYNESGCVETQLPKPRQPGTTVSARHLFRQFPVRLKEMQKNGQRELKACVRCVTAYALVRTGVKFCLTHQPSQSSKRTVALKTNGSNSIDECIAVLFTASQAKSLLPLATPPNWLHLLAEDQRPSRISDSQQQLLDSMHLSGRISSPLPGLGRPAGDRQFFYINSRPCQLPRLARLANEVYKQYNRTQFPFLMLHLQLPTDAIDINLTPDKRSIYLSHESLLTACLRVHLHQQLESANGCLSMPLRTVGGGISDFPAASQQPRSSQMPPGADASAEPDIDEDDDCRAGTASSSSSSGANSPLTIFRSQSPLLESTAAPATAIEASTDVAAATVSAGSRQSTIERLRAAFAVNSSASTASSTSKIATVETTGAAASFAESSPPKKKQKSLAAFWSVAPAKPLDDGSSLRRSLSPIEVAAESTTEVRSSSKYSQSTQKKLQSAEDAPAGKEVFVYDDCPEFGGADDPAMPAAGRARSVCSFQLDRLLRLYATCAESPTAADNEAGTRSRYQARIRPEDSAAAEAELRASLDRDGLRRLRPLGQFNLGFLPCLLDTAGDVFLIDQHAADEKCRFEALQRDGRHLTRQPLAAPKRLRLTFAQEETVAAALARFSAARFDIEVDQDAPVGSRLRLLSVPLGLGKWSFGLSDLEELIELVAADDGAGCDDGVGDAPPAPLLLPSRVRAMLASRACRSAVMIGDALDARQRARIVASLAELDQPWNCPHGRPTIRHLLHAPEALSTLPLYPD